MGYYKNLDIERQEYANTRGCKCTGMEGCCFFESRQNSTQRDLSGSRPTYGQPTTVKPTIKVNS